MSKATKGVIYQLYREGFSAESIARGLGINLNEVNNIIKEWEDGKDI